MRPHGPPWHRRGPPPARGWVVSLHRRVLFTVLSTFLFGGFAGVALHRALGSGTAGAWAAFGLLSTLVVPAAFVAVVRIARPVRELARIATQLREGQLDRRAGLPAAGDREVAAVSDALGGLADRVQRQLDDQKALLAAVSHELRSPLGRLRVQAELLRDGIGGAAVVDEVQQEIDGMDALVADLLAAARIDFAAVRPAELDAADVAARALASSGLPAERFDGAATAIRADPTLLGRAIGVLLDNGSRYGGRVVRLGVVAEADRVRFEVDDDGPGFADGEAEMAFQPFWRRPGETASGTGLGLALVRQIAGAHGGAAGASARPGGGARVWLELPR